MSSADHELGRTRSRSSLAKVCFPLSEEDRSYGVEAENIWAECIGAGNYRIDNIPFYVYGISLDDVVFAKIQNGRLVFDRVLLHSGHSTYRVLIQDEAGFDSTGFKRLWQTLEQLGCTYEVAKRRWVSIDVPAETDVFAVYKALETGEQDAVWTFEEAHCGHSV